MRGNTKMVLVFTAVSLLFAGVAMADSLAVNNAAAMGGTGTACSGSNCGLEVTHDNSSIAYVQDSSPTDEGIYRATFLFNPASITTSANYRQTIFTAIGDNPNPNVGQCPGAAFISSVRCFSYQTGGSGQNSSIQCFGRGNQCGEANVPRIAVTENDPVRVCIEYSTGNSLTGMFALAVVDDQASCPPSGDPAYNTRAMTNGLTNVQLVRLGTPQTNNFGAGESSTFYFDEFESFRTLAGM